MILHHKLNHPELPLVIFIPSTQPIIWASLSREEQVAWLKLRLPRPEQVKALEAKP